MGTAVQIAAGLVLAIAGVGKLFRGSEFKGILNAYELVPAPLLTPTAVLIVVLEISTGVALIAGWQVATSALVAAGLYAIFAAAMAINLVRGRTAIDCGCFRSTRQPLEWRLVVRNIGYALSMLVSAGFTLASADPQRWIQALPAAAALCAVHFALASVWALDASRTAAFTRN